MTTDVTLSKGLSVLSSFFALCWIWAVWHVQTRLGFFHHMFKGNIYSISLCRSCKSSEEVQYFPLNSYLSFKFYKTISIPSWKSIFGCRKTSVFAWLFCVCSCAHLTALRREKIGTSQQLYRLLFHFCVVTYSIVSTLFETAPSDYWL